MSLTPEQKRFRLLGYGSSEVAAIVGVGMGRREDVYAAKVAPDFDGDEDENLPADLGTLLEEPVARIYAKRVGRYLLPVGSLQHPSMPLAIATPDRAVFTEEPNAGLLDTTIARLEDLAGAERLAEIKTTQMRYRGDYGPDGSAEVPEEKAIQAVWQMGVTGLKLVDMPVLFIGEWKKELAVFHISYNDKLFGYLYEEVARFDRDFVKQKRPPSPDGSDRYDEFLKRVYPVANVPPRVATEDEEELMLLFAKLREAEGRIEKAKKFARQKLIKAIGSAGGLISARYGTLTYKNTKDQTSVDWSKSCNEALNLAALVIAHLPEGEERTELEARHRAVVSSNTSTKTGYRRLNPSWAGEAALELAHLNMMLDPFNEPKE